MSSHYKIYIVVYNNSIIFLADRHVTFGNIIFSIGFAHIGRVGSVAVTISIAIERYMSVCHPINRTHFRHLLFFLPITFSILYNIPKFFEIVRCTEEEIYRTMIANVALNDRHNEDNDTSIRIFNNITNETITFDGIDRDDITLCDPYQTRATSLRNNKWYIVLYVFLSELILIEIMPWITVIVLNISTWKGIRSFQKKRQTLKTRSSKTQGTINIFNYQN